METGTKVVGLVLGVGLLLTAVDEIQAGRCEKTLAKKEFVLGETTKKEIKLFLGKPDFRKIGSRQEIINFVDKLSFDSNGRYVARHGSNQDVWVYEHKMLFGKNHLTYFSFQSSGRLRGVYNNDVERVKITEKKPDTSHLLDMPCEKSGLPCIVDD